MPTVVSTAMSEQPISIHSMMRSTALRARKAGAIRDRTTSDAR